MLLLQLTCAHLSCCPCACPGPQAISQKCDERGAAAVAATRQTDEEEAEAEDPMGSVSVSSLGLRPLVAPSLAGQFIDLFVQFSI